MYIYGEKVMLRAIEERDNEMLRSMVNDPEIEKLIVGYSWPVSEADQQKWFANLKSSRDMLRCVVETLDEGRAIGTMIMTDIDMKNGTAELHMKLIKDGGQGKGYGTDCLRAVIRYAFRDLRLNCLYANMLDYNRASQRILEKCGFSKEGVLRSRCFKDGTFHDLYAYSLLAQEYFNP